MRPKVLVVSAIGHTDPACTESWLHLDYTPIEYLLSRSGEAAGCHDIEDRVNYPLFVESVTRARNLVLDTAMNMEWDYLLWLDSDVWVAPSTLTRLVRYTPREKVITAPAEYRQPGAGSVLDYRDPDGTAHWTGWHCILVAREVHENVGWFACPRGIIGEDVEYSERMKALGYKIFIAEDVVVQHRWKP